MPAWQSIEPQPRSIVPPALGIEPQPRRLELPPFRRMGARRMTETSVAGSVGWGFTVVQHLNAGEAHSPKWLGSGKYDGTRAIAASAARFRAGGLPAPPSLRTARRSIMPPPSLHERDGSRGYGRAPDKTHTVSG